MENNKKENFRQFTYENFNQTTEEDVGIIEFINKADEAFECVLKHRYSDFLVNEISENGKVIWLKINSQDEKTTEKTNDHVQEYTKNENQIKNDDSQIQENTNHLSKEINNKNNNKKKIVLKPELVEDIIKKYFVGQQIMDEEDGTKFRDLITKYNDRYCL